MEANVLEVEVKDVVELSLDELELAGGGSSHHGCPCA